jgi:hypothetical protein
LDVSGDVRWTGTLQGGSVPWARLTNFPSACPSGQFVTAVGTTLICASPPSGGIGGSGTTNYVAKFTGATTIGNSQIYDNGTNVGIGTTSPQAKLDVAGNVKIGSSSTTCDANHRGELRVELGGAGVDDKLWMCMQNTAGSFVWVLVARGG